MHNIIASFDDANAADRAIRRLVLAGIPREHLHFEPSADAAFRAHEGPSQPKPGSPGYRAPGILKSFGSFWANLLESHSDESGIYSRALRRGTSLLYVECSDSLQADTARFLLRDAGATRLEDHAFAWHEKSA